MSEAIRGLGRIGYAWLLEMWSAPRFATPMNQRHIFAALVVAVSFVLAVPRFAAVQAISPVHLSAAPAPITDVGWVAGYRGSSMAWRTPDDINRFQKDQQLAYLGWLSQVVSQ